MRLYRVIQQTYAGNTRYIPQFKTWFGWKSCYDELDGYLTCKTFNEAKQIVDSWADGAAEKVVYERGVA